MVDDKLLHCNPLCMQEFRACSWLLWHFVTFKMNEGSTPEYHHPIGNKGADTYVVKSSGILWLHLASEKPGYWSSTSSLRLRLHNEELC